MTVLKSVWNHGMESKQCIYYTLGRQLDRKLGLGRKNGEHRAHGVKIKNKKKKLSSGFFDILMLRWENQVAYLVRKSVKIIVDDQFLSFSKVIIHKKDFLHSFTFTGSPNIPVSCHIYMNRERNIRLYISIIENSKINVSFSLSVQVFKMATIFSPPGGRTWNYLIARPLVGELMPRCHQILSASLPEVLPPP